MQRYRIYFNRWADTPLIWSYDEGTQESEVTISGWTLFGCEVRSGMDLSVPANDREHPRVWMEFEAARIYTDPLGHAKFYFDY